MNKLLGIALLAGILVIFGIYGYNKWSGKASGNEFFIEKDGAKSLNVNIDFGVGDLFIKGGSSEWITGDANYNHKRFEPNVTYKNHRNVGDINIKQRSQAMNFFKTRKMENEWDIQLTNDIPIDLDVDMGVSNSTLELGGIQLSSLTIDSGVSDSVIDLSGEWSKSFKADLDVGVGDVTLILPKDTGVRIKVSKGIGTFGSKGLISQGNQTYVNEVYADADVIIDLKIDIGVGDVNVVFE